LQRGGNVYYWNQTKNINIFYEKPEYFLLELGKVSFKVSFSIAKKWCKISNLKYFEGFDMSSFIFSEVVDYTRRKTSGSIQDMGDDFEADKECIVK
jgi:hypothetical protein